MSKKLYRAWFAPLCALLLTACGPLQGMVVELTLTGVPGRATKVVVTAGLDSKPAQPPPAQFLRTASATADPVSYTVSVVLQPLPAAGSMLSLSVTASDGTPAVCATGTGATTLSGQAQPPLTIPLAACPQWGPVSPGTGQPKPLSQVWARSASDAWAVGPMATILHWNGAQWSPTTTGTQADLNGVWSSAASDAWAVGAPPAGGMGAGKATILHWDGSSWTPPELDVVQMPPAGALYGVWGSSANNIWAVGAVGAIMRYDGKNWAPPFAGGTLPQKDLYQVSGSSAGNIYMAGDSGTVVSFHGLVPTLETGTGTTQALRGLWVSPKGVVWAVGAMGTIIQRTLPVGGFTAVKTDPAVTVPLNGVWGSDERDIWIVGGAGTLLHWDGTSWMTVPVATQPGEALTGVSGTSPTDVWAVGSAGTILHLSR